ncbi:DNA damage-inducible transcript 3 protein [Pogoniulus pusillus]|uniref:DNA damage-inducible transcript 3 protein n=1 Tax=Pogoniulus pusillus TaxID=488313 RepID=UPI0030B937CF
MAAEGLPAEDPSWELEAWYQDLQEVLAAAEPGGHCPAWGAEQTQLALPWGTEMPADAPEICQLDTTLLTELLGPEGTNSTEPAAAAGTTCPARLGTEEEQPRGAAVPGGLKRRRRRSSSSSEGARRQGQASEQLVRELRAHNQRLREEVARLSAEVARTRAALIDRIVNLRRA